MKIKDILMYISFFFFSFMGDNNPWIMNQYDLQQCPNFWRFETILNRKPWKDLPGNKPV